MSKSDNQEGGLTRRELVVLGSIGAVGTVAACSSALPSMAAAVALPSGAAKLTTRHGGTKPVVLPQQVVNDPISLSVADSLFWTDKEIGSLTPCCGRTTGLVPPLRVVSLAAPEG